MNNNQDKLNDVVYDGIIKENINQERLNNEYQSNIVDKKNNTKIFLYILLILQIMLLIFQILLLRIFDIRPENRRVTGYCSQAISCTDCNGTTCTCIYCADETCDDIREVTCPEPDRTGESSSSSTGTT